MKNEKSENILNKKEENMSYKVKPNEFQIEDEKNQEIKRGDVLIKKILREGMEKYVNSLGEKIEKVFREVEKGTFVACIDEGTPFGEVRIAGSGILLNKSPKEVAELLWQLRLDGVKIERITSHDGCGAAALYFKEHVPIDKKKTADDTGKEFAEEVAKELGVQHRHYKNDELERSENFHSARVVYYDGTGKFNPKYLIKELPLGFQVSRKYFSGSSAKEVELAVNIIFGNHGLGERKFSKESPFILIAVADPDNKELSLEKIKTELKEVAKKFGDKVKVDGFTAPSKK